MSVLYFGSYNADYSRNRIIIKGLRRNGKKIYECHAKGFFIPRYIKLIKKFTKVYKRIDNIIVGFPGHTDVPLAFILGKIYKKRVFFDVFTSQYETYIEDRKHFKKNSLQAKIYYFIDWIGLHIADYILVDTKEHRKYFVNTFGIKNSKCIVVYLGSDNDIFFPQKNKITTDVLFYGYFQPLHGVMTIVKTAKLLPDTSFMLIGVGQDRSKVEDFILMNRVQNVKIINPLPIKSLAKEINCAEIMLGIFGKTKKGSCVIPNKIYDGLSSRKPVITSNTASIQEIFINNENCVLVKKADPLALKNAIVLLLKNAKLRNKIASTGYKLYLKLFQPALVVKNITKVLR